MILVISTAQDDHARAVLKYLAPHPVETMLLDLAQFPQMAQLAMDFRAVDGHRGSVLTGYNGDVCLADCDVVWWRRPQPFVLHPEVTDEIYRSFAYAECYAAISGLWLTMDATWVNHPMREEEAARKAYQLKVASAVDLTIPTTLITNSPSRARAFVFEHGFDSTIYKSFSAMDNAWRETRMLKPHEVAFLDSVCYAPVIFQEYVPAQLDLRVTVTGDEIFAASIDTPDANGVIDYRMQLDQACVKPFDLPTAIAARIHALMDQMGLVYGAIDMRLKPDGEYVFLEVNPSGQWLFIEERTGLPITAAFSDYLIQHAIKRDL